MIILVLLLGLGLRWVNLNQSLWLDEATQLLLSQKTLYSIYFERGADFHPPLSYLLMHFWMMFGTSEPVLRLFSVLVGALTILVVYLLAREFFSKTTAIITGLLLTISPYHIYYSQEVRMYSLATLFATLSSYFYLRSNWLFYVVTSSLLIWTHYLGVLLVVSQLTHTLIFNRTKIRQLILSLGLVLITYLPWLPQLTQQLQGGVNIDSYLPGWRGILTLEWYKAIPLTIFKFSAGRIDFDNNYLYSALILVVLLTVGLCFWSVYRSKWTKEKYYLLFWFLTPLIFSLVISQVIPLNQPFRLLFILPAFYLLLALGIQNLGKLKYLIFSILVTISVFGLSLYFTQAKFQRENWREAAELINQQVGQDVVLFVWPESFPPYIWYKGSDRYIALADKFPIDYQQLNSKMKDKLPEKVYLFEYLIGLSDPDGVTKNWLKDHRYEIGQVYNFEGVGFVDQYVRR